MGLGSNAYANLGRDDDGTVTGTGMMMMMTITMKYTLKIFI
jgi:hypothetical protein